MNPLQADFDLGAALAEDHSGVLLRQIKDILEQQRSALRRKADQGMTSEEFAVAQNLQQACLTASELMERLWKPRP